MVIVPAHRRRLKHLAAGGRQVGEHDLPRRMGGRRRRLIGRGGEPVVELRSAAVARRRRRLRAAVGPGGARKPNVEMIVVPVIGPDLPEPAAVASRHLAELLLDPRRDEDALHPRVERGTADQPPVRRRPAVLDRLDAARARSPKSPTYFLAPLRSGGGRASESARYRRRGRSGARRGRRPSGRRAAAPCRRPVGPASRPSPRRSGSASRYSRPAPAAPIAGYATAASPARWVRRGEAARRLPCSRGYKSRSAPRAAPREASPRRRAALPSAPRRRRVSAMSDESQDQKRAKHAES